MANRMEFIDLKSQYKAYKDEIDERVLNIFSSAQFILGKEVEDLEYSLAKFVGSKHCITAASGTDALLISLMSLDIKTGDEVITTPFTFYASAEVIALLGATPVFVDINESTYNIDYSKLKDKITGRTKAIMPISLYGQVADMDEIKAIAGDIPVIEDACQSFGAIYKGKRSCNLSTVGVTSFFPSKPLGCYGDGGALFCNDDELAKRIRITMNHGQSERYMHKHIGINGRLDAVQAAVLNVKMKYIDDELKKREELGELYSKKINALGRDIITPKILSDRNSVYAQYSIRVKNRSKVMAKLNEAGIPTAIHYPIPLHLQEAFGYLGLKRGDFPISELISDEIISLPMSPFLKVEDQDYIVDVLGKSV